MYPLTEIPIYGVTSGDRWKFESPLDLFGDADPPDEPLLRVRMQIRKDGCLGITLDSEPAGDRQGDITILDSDAWTCESEEIELNLGPGTWEYDVAYYGSSFLNVPITSVVGQIKVRKRITQELDVSYDTLPSFDIPPAITGGTGLNDTLARSLGSAAGATSLTGTWWNKLPGGSYTNTSSSLPTYTAARVDGETIQWRSVASNPVGGVTAPSNEITAVYVEPSDLFAITDEDGNEYTDENGITLQLL